MVLRSRDRGRVGHRRLLMKKAPCALHTGPFSHAHHTRTPGAVRRLPLEAVMELPPQTIIGAGTSIAAAFLLKHEHDQGQAAERLAAAALETLLNAIDANDPETGAHVR